MMVLMRMLLTILASPLAPIISPAPRSQCPADCSFSTGARQPLTVGWARGLAWPGLAASQSPAPASGSGSSDARQRIEPSRAETLRSRVSGMEGGQDTGAHRAHAKHRWSSSEAGLALLTTSPQHNNTGHRNIVRWSTCDCFIVVAIPYYKCPISSETNLTNIQFALRQLKAFIGIDDGKFFVIIILSFCHFRY